jgi:hypothetical protein
VSLKLTKTLLRRAIGGVFVTSKGGFVARVERPLPRSLILRIMKPRASGDERMKILVDLLLSAAAIAGAFVSIDLAQSQSGPASRAVTALHARD